MDSFADVTSEQNSRVWFSLRKILIHYDKRCVLLYPGRKTTVTERNNFIMRILCYYIRKDDRKRKAPCILYEPWIKFEKLLPLIKSFLGNKSIVKFTQQIQELKGMIFTQFIAPIIRKQNLYRIKVKRTKNFRRKKNTI